MCRLMPVMHERCTRQTKRLFGCHIDTAPSLTVEKAEPVCPWLPPGAMPGREVPAKARRRGHPRGHLATMMGTDLVPDAMTRLARCCTLPVQRCQRGDALLRAVAVITRPSDLTRPRSPGGKPLPGASPRVFRLQAVGPGGPRRSWARPRRPRGLRVHRQPPLLLATWPRGARDQRGDRGIARGGSGRLGMASQLMAPGLQLMGRQNPPPRGGREVRDDGLRKERGCPCRALPRGPAAAEESGARAGQTDHGARDLRGKKRPEPRGRGRQPGPLHAGREPAWPLGAPRSVGRPQPGPPGFARASPPRGEGASPAGPARPRGGSPVATAPRSGALRGRGPWAMKTAGRVPSRSPPSRAVMTGPEIPAGVLKVKPMWRGFHDELY